MKFKIDYTVDINNNGILNAVNEFVHECIDSERTYHSLYEVPMNLIIDALSVSGILLDELQYAVDESLLNITEISNEPLSDTRFY